MPASARGAGPSSPPHPPAEPAAAGADRGASPRPPRGRSRSLELLLRFISCGLLALVTSLAWRVTLAPPSLGAASALAGVLSLLVGFILGGLLWYGRDIRLRRRAPDGVDDERLVFSFVVFALMPFAVLILVGIVWILAVIVGAS